MLHFYFDYVSPYSYLAYRDLLRRGVAYEPRPIVFAALLDAAGQRGPAEIPAKRAFLVRDCLRKADRLGVPFTFPARHPFRSIEALRLSLPGPDQASIIDALFTAGWARGEDLGDPSVLSAALAAIGLDGPARLEATKRPEAKAALIAETDAAIERGVFGVPTFVAGDEVVWGSDRIDDVLEILGGVRLDEARVAGQHRAAGATRASVPAPVERAMRALFRTAPFVDHLGVEVELIERERVVTTLRVRPEHLQQDGFVHAGVVSTLADHTAGAAAGTVMEPGQTPLTVEYKVNLLRPAKGPNLTCRSAVLRAGKRITVAESEVLDIDGASERLVAKATVTLAVVDRAGLATKRSL